MHDAHSLSIRPFTVALVLSPENVQHRPRHCLEIHNYVDDCGAKRNRHRLRVSAWVLCFEDGNPC
jgi:hypothetical protein